MGSAMFYHLTRAPVEVSLADLATRALARDLRVAVRGVTRERMAWLDEKLWLGPEDGFLPHGLADNPHAAEQPVLLGVGDFEHQATCLMAVDGAEVSAQEVTELERVCILFDGNDDAAVQRARGQWKALKDASVSAEYWSEASGRWEKKATT